jgi:hypothetical protein
MARYAGRLEGYPDWSELHDGGMDLMEAFRVQDAAWNELYERSANLPEGEIVGAMLQWGRGDGHACYVVTNDRPLTIAWTPIVDNWQIEPALIRGLNKSDVETMARQNRAQASIFGRAGRVE